MSASSGGSNALGYGLNNVQVVGIRGEVGEGIETLRTALYIMHLSLQNNLGESIIS